MANQRGFIGLLSLLLGAAVIIFLAVKTLELYHGSASPALNPLEQGRSVINAAEEARRAIESRNLGQ